MEIIDIGGEVKVVTSSNHTFGTDAVLLTHFANPKPKDIILDIGTGCGIIPFLMYRKNKNFNITAVEIQKEAFLQAQEGAKLNGFPLKLFNIDVNDYKGTLLKGSFSLITCNPPYKKATGGIISENKNKANARHELTLTVTDLAKTASELLMPMGRIDICIRPERLADVIIEFNKFGIAVKKIRTVSKDSTVEPKLLLIEGKKGAKSETKLLPPLFLYNTDGTYTDEYNEIIKY